MKWDLFICHASEDKERFVRPLVETLRKREPSIEIWFDEFTLTLGDKLRQKIDYGLANSRFGVVVLSQSFFKKEWAQKELEGLIARESSFDKVILPIWHGVTQQEILKLSPLLANRLAVESSDGMDVVAARILQVLGNSEEPALRRQGKYKTPRAILLVGILVGSLYGVSSWVRGPSLPENTSAEADRQPGELMESEAGAGLVAKHLSVSEIDGLTSGQKEPAEPAESSLQARRPLRLRGEENETKTPGEINESRVGSTTGQAKNETREASPNDTTHLIGENILATASDHLVGMLRDVPFEIIVVDAQAGSPQILLPLGSIRD